MFNPNTFDARWTLALGLPLIAWLVVIARRRTQAMLARIREVKAEMAARPQDSYAALAALMAEQDAEQDRKRVGRR